MGIVNQVDRGLVPERWVAKGKVFVGIFKKLFDSNAVVRNIRFIIENGNGVRGASSVLGTFMISAYKTPCCGSCTDDQNITGGVPRAVLRHICPS